MGKLYEDKIRNYDPIHYQNKEFGKVGFPFEVIKANKEAYAKVFSEGSPALESLLLHLWNNDIETHACCIGHINVPRYTKDTFWGSRSIGEEEYLAHKDSKRYHQFMMSSGAYFSFVLPVNNQILSEVRNEIDQLLLDERPFLHCRASLNNNGIVIRKHRYEYEAETERFFTTVSEVLTKVLGLEQSKDEEVIETFSVEDVSDLIAKATAASGQSQCFDSALSKFKNEQILGV